MKQTIHTPEQLTPILQSARKTARARQSDLAAVLNLSQASLSRLELKPENMKVSQLLGLFSHLGLEFVVQDKSSGDKANGPAMGARGGPEPTHEW